jgi:hypothetical protein
MDDSENNTEHKSLHQRLERIELKMDRLVEALTTMARLEERIGSTVLQNERLDIAYHSLEKRVQCLEKSTAAHGANASWVERFIWQTLGLVGAALVGATAVYLQAQEAINPESWKSPFTHEHHHYEGPTNE